MLVRKGGVGAEPRDTLVWGAEGKGGGAHEVGDHQPLPVLGSKGRNHPKEQTAVKDGKGQSGSRDRTGPFTFCHIEVSTAH